MGITGGIMNENRWGWQMALTKKSGKEKNVSLMLRKIPLFYLVVICDSREINIYVKLFDGNDWWWTPSIKCTAILLEDAEKATFPVKRPAVG